MQFGRRYLGLSKRLIKKAPKGGLSHSKTMDFGSNRGHVVTASRAIRIAAAPWMERDNAAPLRYQLRHDVPPRVPASRPARQQKNGSTFTTLDIVQVDAVNGSSTMAKVFRRIDPAI
jgi:hypothetical protein